MMFSLPHLSKLSLAVGTAAVAATLALSAPASAKPVHPHHPVVHHAPRFYHGRHFYRGPVYHAYGCVIRRKWVLGPFGWHWAHVRVCH